MRVLLAPDKFRGSFTAPEVCTHLRRGLLGAAPGPGAIRVDSLPLADGGEGTLDVLMAARGGTRVTRRVRGPLGAPVDGEYGVLPDGTAVVEAAAFVGLGLIPPGRLDPLKATSFGLGEAIAVALDSGIGNFLIGLGGTATVDGGVGMARALGYRFEDSEGRPVGAEAASLTRIRRIDSTSAHPKLQEARFTCLCDVGNPLLGPRGAARVFGPQKGATPEGARHLESGLAALASAIRSWKGEKGRDPGAAAGSGAAGGLGAGAAAFLGAVLEPGASYLMRAAGFESRIRGSDLVVTGEGSFDGQSAGGKVAGVVVAEAARAGKRVIAVAGSWDGSRPEGAPELQVVTGQDLPAKPAWLKAEDLEKLGALLARIHLA